MFTSGTTADPKGVVHTHNTLDYENRSIIEVYGLGPDDVVFMPSPVTHITGLLYGLQLPAMLGTRVVLQDVWDPAAALRLIEAGTVLVHRRGDPVPVRAGPPSGPGVVRRDVAAGVRLRRRRRAAGPDPAGRRAAGRHGDPGIRLDGIPDAVHLAAARTGRTSGRTPTGGPSGRPSTASWTTPTWTCPSAKWASYWPADRSSSLATCATPTTTAPSPPTAGSAPATWRQPTPTGYVSIRGRKKDIVLRGGENISVTEVENLLFEHPAVREVAIVAMPDPVLTERACAFIVPASGPVPTLADLAEFLLSKQLAKQKLPERLEIVAELPKTQSGKVQKFRLRELIRDKLALTADAP